VFEDVVKYRKELVSMAERGLDPSAIKIHYNPVWITSMPPVTPELAAKIVLFDCNDLIEIDEDLELCKTIEDIEDVEMMGDLATDCGMLCISNESFSLSCNVKHTNVEMGCHVWNSQLELINRGTLADRLAEGGKDDECKVDSDGCLIDNDGDAETDMEVKDA
jgi:hypothetical protein